MQIDNIEICNPVETLIKFLLRNGFVIVDKKISDFHFHELFIKMSGEYFSGIEDIHIDGITQIDDKTFSCSCHWSIVEIMYE
jgi:hypothetical protein